MRKFKNRVKFLGMATIALIQFGCATRYLVKTYPAGAQVYTRDLTSNEKKLVGVSPIEIEGDGKLGDTFFVVVEKQNYKPKEILIRANEGETLAINAKLDPMTSDEMNADAKLAEKKKDDDKPPQQPPQDPKKKMDDLVEELKMRVALLENTTSFYKDAMFSSRFQGNGQAKFDRDRNDKIIDNMFLAQQAISSKDYVKAGTLLDDAIEQDEYLAQAWLLKGSLKYIQNDFAGAKQAWERTLKIDPYDKIAYTYLGKVYEKLGLSRLERPAAALRYPASTVEIETKGNPTSARGNKNP
jgi:tetratricopeptide (TPR) repeat protein